MKVNHINSNLIKININEALRYLGYRNNNVDVETYKLLNESIIELQNICEFKYVYRIFEVKNENNIINFENFIKITSNDLAKLFKDCKKSAVIAATIGFEVEKRIKYFNSTNLTKAVIFDACASAYIEALCDYVESEIMEIAAQEDYNTTFRYSPGYGDVPISHQKEILNALNAQKYIGLSSLDSSILVPRKSVTAFIGFNKGNETNNKSCLNCNLYNNCSFTKKGENSYDK
ncbi:vitamin B12 dependent-methionine synthase activation domain-containing protein [Sedimentibacter sp. MB31-C6]|uniref:vitamin B12 dependent-methionine synthase activation domain-containing protein n=1 Tax=Sedimentibacter sp. MB31-C6 TaxID=3109366 RepID=UPI002DDC9919|nr:vitamin B12 dependent-methionine synthase activation domain-containing protein [Sedimentibacter sp. MB36-C1]WSI03972.1 vitamin B12 dependent-methionine synthase activation domain-containing protein [Sedimentibacter sp. MB36-C1]